MSSRRSNRNSKITSPTKPSIVEEKNEIGSEVTKVIPSIKLRFNAPVSSSVESINTSGMTPLIPKLKLKLSTSNPSIESVTGQAVSTAEEKPKSRRGRPAKKDAKASQSTESINSSSSSDSNSSGKKRGRKPYNHDQELHDSGEHVTIVDEALNTSKRKLSKSPTVATVANTAPPLSYSEAHVNRNASISPQENELIQRTKAALNIALQHDTHNYNAAISTPNQPAFNGMRDAIETLLSFHLAASTGFYNENAVIDKYLDAYPEKKVESTYEDLVARYQGIIHSASSKKVSSELLLLEQKLCLEEEKFLLVKLKQEYYARFSSGSVSSLSSLSSQLGSRSGTPSLLSRSASSSYDSLPR